MRSLILVLIVIASLFSVSGVKAQTPTPSAHCSPDVQSDAVTVNFVNYTTRPVVLYWVDTNCKEEFYAKFSGQHSQPTFVGHVWHVRDQATNALVAEFAARDTTDVGFAIGAFDPLPEKLACTPNAQTDALTLTFVNYTSQSVTLYWVDVDCQQKSYATLKPGAYYEQPTYVGHSWFVRDDATKIILTEFIAREATNVTVPIGARAVVPGTVCSSDSSTALPLTYVNYTSRQVDVVWVDPDCKEKLYQTLDAGKSYDVQTYEGHVWRVYDHDNKLLIDEITAHR